MKVEIQMPHLGESIVEGTIVEWHKKPGDVVSQDEDLFTVSTDKVDADVPVPKSGTLVEIRAEVDDTVEVGDVVAVIDTEGEAAGAADANGDAESADDTSEDQAAADDSAEDQTAADGASNENSDENSENVATEDPSDEEPFAGARITEMAKKILIEAGITDTSGIEGSGAGGRILKADALSHIENASDGQKGASEDASDGQDAAGDDAQANSESASDEVKGRNVPPPPMHLLQELKERARRQRQESPVVVNEGDDVEEMTPLMTAIGQRMVRSRAEAAHCSTVWEVDVTNIVNARKTLKPEYAERGVKLTFTPYFIAAIVDGLRQFPVLNASVRGDEIVYRGEFNIGIATPWNDGMVVPVVHNADSLNLLGIARKVNDINRRIQSEDLRPSDVEYGTFTLTNSGIYGSLYSVPTILQPQVAIMGIGRIAKRVMVEHDDTIRIRSTVHLSLTFDHRIVNFRQADLFMSHVRKYLENWTDGE